MSIHNTAGNGTRKPQIQIHTPLTSFEETENTRRTLRRFKYVIIPKRSGDTRNASWRNICLNKQRCVLPRGLAGTREPPSPEIFPVPHVWRRGKWWLSSLFIALNHNTQCCKCNPNCTQNCISHLKWRIYNCHPEVFHCSAPDNIDYDIFQVGTNVMINWNDDSICTKYSTWNNVCLLY